MGDKYSVFSYRNKSSWTAATERVCHMYARISETGTRRVTRILGNL